MGVEQTQKSLGQLYHDLLWLSVILTMVGLLTLWLYHSGPADPSLPPQELSFELYYYPGAPGGSAAMVLTLGKDISSQNEYETWAAVHLKGLEPSFPKLFFNPLYGKSSFRFSSSREPALSGSCILVSRPPVSELSFPPAQEYLWIFRLPAAKLRSGDALRAQFSYASLRLKSNTVTVPPPPKDQASLLSSHLVTAGILGEAHALVGFEPANRP